MLNVTNMRIYELRDYARNVGVKSPTSKVKKQLINEINLIETGKLKPTKATKGRKPLMSFALNDKNKEFVLKEIKVLQDSVNQGFENFYKKIKKS